MASIASTGEGRLSRALRGSGHALLLTYRRGGEAFWKAPALVALAVVPQFAQHAWEMNAGMFASIDAFRALQMEPARWVFGYAKVAGLLAAIVLIARFRACGSVRRAILMPRRDVVTFALLLGATILIEWVTRQLGGRFPAASPVATGVNLLLQFALTFPLVAALLSDRETSLSDGLCRRWLATLFMLALAAAAFGPASLLHKANHAMAFGAPEAVDWALMAFDSLVVGLLAALVGSALAIGHAAAPGLGGWRRDPRALG